MSFDWTPAAPARRGLAPVVQAVLYEFDGPRMVLAVDEAERQWLGVAADEDADGNVRWVYAPASPERVLALLETRRGLRALFDAGPLEIVDVGPGGEPRSAWSVVPDDVPDAILPDVDAVLPELLPEPRSALEAAQRALLVHRGPVARTRLYFGGRPVRGQRAIDATFAADMLSGYQDLVAKALGQRRRGALGAFGPIPARGESTLLLSDMPRGSVGFELVEDAEHGSLLPTVLAEVVADVGALLDAAASDDQSYAEAVADFDKRVVDSAHAFMERVNKAEATLRLDVDGRTYAFDATRLGSALERSASSGVREEDQTVVGTLIGFLPFSHRFELMSDDGLVKGRVARDADVDAIAAEYRKRCTMRLRVVTVGGSARGYTLLAVEPAEGSRNGSPQAGS